MSNSPDKEKSTIEGGKNRVREAREEKRAGKMERNRRTGRGGRKHFRSNCQIPLTHRHRCGTLQQTLCSELTGRRNEANSKGACPPGPLDPPGWSKMLKCVM